MMYLKFLVTFLLEIIRKNIVKMLYLIGVILFFHYAGTIPNSMDEYEVAAQVKVDNNYVYVCRTATNNELKYENIWNSKEMPVKNGKIYISSYSDANVLLWIGFSICLILLVVSSLIKDEDMSWELEDCWKEAFGTLIYCEEENGVYYYFALGRLIEKRDRQVARNYGICSELRIDGFRELYNCPKYQTKTQRRETLLSKIGIN